VSFADFMTLLFALFVVLYACSQADMAKMKKVASGIRQAFSSGPMGMIDVGGASGGNTLNAFQSEDPAGGRVQDLPAGKANTAADPDPQLQEIRELLEEAISLDLGATEISDQLQLQFDSRGLVVRIAAKDFFEENTVEVKQDLRPILDRIGRILSKTKRLIRLEGHTDLAESRPPGFPSDWELSSARAAWVAKYWMSRYDFDPARLAVAGYSHFRPLTEQTDRLSRAKNRRVEMIILNNLYEAP
jgi:chemotaxis protein MotB